MSDPASGHGMVVLGVDTIFLTHLAMFMRPHDYQVVLQASFGVSDSIYRDDRAANPNTRLYTFAPRRFVLPELFPGQNGEPPLLTSFVGSLFRNHFEQPPAHSERPVEIASDVRVQVIDVVHQHKFNPGAQPLEPLTYIMFGKGRERLLEHRINKPPDFAHDLAVDVQGHDFSDDELRHGVEVMVTGRPNNHGSKIQEGEQVPAVVRRDGQEIPVEIDAKVELYFETDDLKDAM